MTLVQSNFDFCQQTIALKQTIETSFLSLGERLSQIRDDKKYVGQFETFELFLEEAKISPATASKLINIYQKFYIQWEFKAQELVDAGGWSVVATLLPVCRSREEAQGWLETAQIKSRGDLERDLKESRTGIDMSKCQHQDHYVVKVCRTCGDRFKSYENEDQGK